MSKAKSAQPGLSPKYKADSSDGADQDADMEDVISPAKEHQAKLMGMMSAQKGKSKGRNTAYVNAIAADIRELA